MKALKKKKKEPAKEPAGHLEQRQYLFLQKKGLSHSSILKQCFLISKQNEKQAGSFRKSW